MNIYYDDELLEAGIDEVARGTLAGPVFAAAVILPKDFEIQVDRLVIKDSKKCTEKYRQKCFDYIQQHSIAYSIHMLDHEEIDTKNILQCSIEGMHRCLTSISEEADYSMILVDGNHFQSYYCPVKDDFINHQCIIKGDNEYKSIAAASILAKTYRDNYIIDMVKEHPELQKYGIERNKGYGTKEHMNAIREHGITQWHRKSFAPCQVD